jgi:hypothetical protein
MVAPINYAIDVASPIEQAVGGLRLGVGVAELQAKQQEMARAAQQRQQAALEQQRFFSLESPTIQDVMRYSAFLPPEQAKVLSDQFGTLDKGRQQGMLQFAGQVLSSVAAGKPEIAAQLLRDRSAAERDPQQAKGYADLAMMVESSPNDALKIIGPTLAALPSGKDLIENLGKVQEQQRQEQLFGPELRKAQADADTAVAQATKEGVLAEFARPTALAQLTSAQAKAISDASDASFRDALNQAGLNEKNWNVRNLQSQITDRSQARGLDAQRTYAEVQERLANIAAKAVEIPAASQKLVNDAAVSAASAKQQAGQFNALATNLERLGGGYGAFSTASEFLKKTTGNQDYVSQLRQEYTRLRNSAAVQSLPPGPATDRDIALVLEGFPPPTADARTMAGFMRGMAKLQDITASVEGAKVDWLAGNRGNLTRATNGFIAGDYRVNPGETWVDFSSRVVGDVSKRYAPPTDRRLEQIPTGAAPIPAQAAPGPSIRSQADAIIGVR